MEKTPERYPATLIHAQGVTPLQVRAILNGLAREAQERGEQLNVSLLPPHTEGACTLLVQERTYIEGVRF